MAKYRLCKKKNRLNADKDGLWYAEPVAGRQMRTRTVCRLATKNLTLSAGELELGLEALGDCLPDLLAQGNLVSLGRLGTLRLEFGSEGVAEPEDFTTRHIRRPRVVFQPSKEILEQNFAKLQSYGVFDCGVYSASAGSKDINRITFATIGSVMNHVGDFARFRNILIDECHLTNAKGGQYKEFIEAQDRRVVGLTATPYRLGQGLYGMSMLKFLTRTRPRIFDDVLYYCQVSDLLAKGFLADLRYFDCTTLDMSNVKTNSTGADYDDESLKLEYERSGFGKMLRHLKSQHQK